MEISCVWLENNTVCKISESTNFPITELRLSCTSNTSSPPCSPASQGESSHLISQLSTVDIHPGSSTRKWPNQHQILLPTKKKPNTPLLGDANVGDRHDAEVLTENAELVKEGDGGRGMAQQGGEVRDEMAGPHPALANDELDANTPLLDDADVGEIHKAMVEELTQPFRPTANSSQAPVQPTCHLEDEQSIVAIPRETFEEMMRAWSKILIQGLKKESLCGERRNDDVELGEIPPAAIVETRPEDEIQLASSGEGFWDGGHVEVFSEEEIKAEDGRRALELRAEVEEHIRPGYYPRTELKEPTGNIWASHWIGNDERRSERQKKTH